MTRNKGGRPVQTHCYRGHEYAVTGVYLNAKGRTCKECQRERYNGNADYAKRKREAYAKRMRAARASTDAAGLHVRGDPLLRRLKEVEKQ